MAKKISIRRAKISDAKKIKELISHYAAKEKLLDRSLISIFEHLRGFMVAEEEGRVIGCCCTHICWEGLGEVRSLAVAEGKTGLDIGTTLVRACLKEAKELGLKKVFTLTYVPEFFSKCGFKEIKKEDLPHKIWHDCIHCAKFPDCDETAMMIEI
ncbi:MAG: N-acetyltransferase [Candidatus ainarchaeum sp.]|nr:N-acetyltransferase [Candidatus ainarchaeum sp.]